MEPEAMLTSENSPQNIDEGASNNLAPSGVTDLGTSSRADSDKPSKRYFGMKLGPVASEEDKKNVLPLRLEIHQSLQILHLWNRKKSSSSSPAALMRRRRNTFLVRPATPRIREIPATPARTRNSSKREENKPSSVYQTEASSGNGTSSRVNLALSLVGDDNYTGMLGFEESFESLFKEITIDNSYSTPME